MFYWLPGCERAAFSNHSQVHACAVAPHGSIEAALQLMGSNTDTSFIFWSNLIIKVAVCDGFLANENQNLASKAVQFAHTLGRPNWQWTCPWINRAGYTPLMDHHCHDTSAAAAARAFESADIQW
jgi:hypothetical protein